MMTYIDCIESKALSNVEYDPTKRTINHRWKKTPKDWYQIQNVSQETFNNLSWYKSLGRAVNNLYASYDVVKL